MAGERVLRVAVAATLSIAMFNACGDDDSEPTDTTTPAQIANPASEFCVEQGGTVEIVDEAGGQAGYCNLPDGTRVEEWEYFTSQTGGTAPP